VSWAERDRLHDTGRRSFVVSHPSLEKSEGWGTHVLWEDQDFKNLGHHPSIRCTLATVFHKRSVHWLNQTGIRNLDLCSSVMSAFQSSLAQGFIVYCDLSGCWYLPGTDGLDCRHHYSRLGRTWRVYGIFFQLLCFIPFPMLFGSTLSRS
jgi:hypothetical protein